MGRELQDGWTTGGLGEASSGSEAAQIERLTRFASPEHAHLKAEPWANSPAVQTALATTGAELQSIQSGSGDYIYDEYRVTIDRMPPGVTPETYLAELANDLNGAVGNETFNRINEFERLNTGSPPQIGDIYHIDILGPDNGSVMLVERRDSSFTFQTVATPQDGTHPESGSRQFGFERNPDGSVTFFTRGASRPGFPGSASIGRPLQEQGWTSMMNGIAGTLRERGAVVRQGSIESWSTHRSDHLGSGVP
jgi:hypothetical protein